MDLSKQKLLLRLAGLLMLISILLAYTLNLIDTSFFLWLESMISYKLLLCFWLLTTLILLYLLSSQKLYSNYNDAPTSNSEAKLNELKNSSNQSTEDNFESRMENLSPAEASKLMRFLEEKNKVIIAKYDSIIKVLIRNEVLSCLKYNAQSPSEIMISEWAWKWINENKDKLKSKL